MRVTIHFSSRPRRPKPKVGDRRTIGGVEHIRVFKLARDMRGRVIGYDCTGGRQRYEWVSLSEARKHCADHHLTKEERALFCPREQSMQQGGR